MAKYNEILAGRLNNALKKFLSMKGPAPSPQIASEMTATFALFWGVENRFLEEWTRFGARFQIAGVAAQTAAFRLRNPANSNVIIVVEKLNVFGLATDQPNLQFGPQTADYAAPTTGFRLDARARSNSTGIVSSSGTGVAMTNTIEQCAYPANQTYDFIVNENQEIPILAGDAAQIISNVVNQQLNGSIIWRERVLEESERQ